MLMLPWWLPPTAWRSVQCIRLVLIAPLFGDCVNTLHSIIAQCAAMTQRLARTRGSGHLQPSMFGLRVLVEHCPTRRKARPL